MGPTTTDPQHLRFRRENLRTDTVCHGLWNHLVSVVVFGSENNPAGLSKTLESLLGQRYRNIEIIVAGGALPKDHSPADFMTLRGLFVRPDVNVVDLLSSEAHDNDWRGDYLLFAAAGTVFDPRCFADANHAINEHGEAFPDLAVLDYQIIQTGNTECTSVFLPGWDPEFALSNDSYRTAWLVSQKLIKRTRGQSVFADFNTWVRSVAKLHPQPKNVHISEPVIKFSQDLGIIEMGTVPDRLEGCSDPNPTVSLIIPNRNRPDLLKSCLKFLERIQGIDLDLVIVDNDSDDRETLKLYGDLRQRIGAQIVNAGSKFNYSRMVNLGVTASNSEYIALVNNDIEFKIAGEFESLVQQAMRPEVGIVGARLFYPSGKIQHAGVVIDTGILQNFDKEFRCQHVLRSGRKNEDHPFFPQNANRNYLAVTGAVQVMKRKTFDLLGGYDEVYLPIEYNDIDFCLRAKQEGLRVLCVALDGVYHRESESRGTEDTPETLRMREKATQVMLSRWGAFVKAHPYGHPAIKIGDRPIPSLISPHESLKELAT
jgi:GT2 family glycosyltransferase